jgi:hypothetical protein
MLSLFFFLARLNLSVRPEERPNPDSGPRQQAAQCPFSLRRGAARRQCYLPVHDHINCIGVRLLHRCKLLSPQESDPCREGATVEIAEGEKLRRSNIVIYREWILMVRNVIEAATQCPVEPERVEPLLQVQVQCNVARITVRSRRSHDLLLIVEC